MIGEALNRVDETIPGAMSIYRDLVIVLGQFPGLDHQMLAHARVRSWLSRNEWILFMEYISDRD